ncbi:rhodanese domain-containing protein [Tepidicaulis marinus]|uniref:Rhodanese domain-containing protein n=1 Tax=Tepidicaulis marinus TaxID=1333998 RepID=A0A081B9C9_9HYPH|nr:rhodanese family protein [Tepidicaulis marinus]GAK44647.1 rhodanese domain-containing protein [Tepidicaulis marinus]
MTALKTITPQEAAKLVKEGASLIDIRGADEHARERIRGAENWPLDQLAPKSLTNPKGMIVYHCKTGMRTGANAQKLAEAASCEAFIVEGGLDAWKKAGLPVLADTSQPLEVNRQVQITAGALVLSGVVLGAAASPAFYLLSAFVGAGLMMAGITGWCGMARLLAIMPWNRRAA